MTRAVLIVDGDEQYVPLLKDVFRRVDFEVFVAQDGEQALALARKHRPDLIMLSVELPAGPAAGYLVCRDLKSDAELQTIPVLMTSRRAKEEDFAKHRKLKTRADDYLRKPFTDEDLFQRVENLLGFRLTNADFEALEAKMHKFLEREDELVRELADRDRRIEALEVELNAAKDVAAKAEAALKEVSESALAVAKSRLEEVEAELKLANKRADRASEDAKAEAARAAELETKLAEREEEIGTLHNQLHKTQLEVEQARAEARAAAARIEEMEAERQALAARIAALEADNAQHQQQLSSLMADLATAQGALAEAQKSQHEAEEAAKISEEAHKEAAREVKRLHKLLAKVRTAAGKIVDLIPESAENE